MPDINMQVFEEVRRNQLVTEIDIQTQVALDDYQVQLSDIANPTQSQDNVIIDRYGEFLPHWNESLDFNSWVKMSMEVAGKRILMLRGNSSVSSVSNGAATFPVLFDDFEDNDVSDWVNEGSNAFVVEGTIKKEGGYSGKSTVVGTQGDETYKTFNATAEALFEFDIRFNLNTLYFAIALDETAGSYLNSIYLRIKNDGSIDYYDGAYHSLGGAGTISANTWYEFKIVPHSTQDTFDIWIDGVSKGVGLGTRGNIDTGIRAISLTGGGFGGGIAYIDNIFQYKYTANQPTWAADGEEQNIGVVLKSLGRAG